MTVPILPQSRSVHPAIAPSVRVARGRKMSGFGAEDMEPIDRESVLADQQDLEALCSERPASGSEIFWPNENYGLSAVLKDYAGYPQGDPVFAVVPHGVYLEDKYVYDSEARAPVPAILLPFDRAQRAWKNRTNKTVIPSAHPILYAIETLGDAISSEGTGTLFFPSHSTAGSPTSVPWKEVIDLLRSVPEDIQPVRVCVHWHDVRAGLHRLFQEAGFTTYSAGYLHDPIFIMRWLYLVSMHRFTLGNELSSTAYYCTVAGRPFGRMGPLPKRVRHPSLDRLPVSDSGKRLRAHAAQLFEGLSQEISDGQRAFSNELLGAHHLKSPEGLRADLDYARSLAK